jgi:hypothetical protein
MEFFKFCIYNFEKRNCMLRMQTDTNFYELSMFHSFVKSKKFLKTLLIKVVVSKTSNFSKNDMATLTYTA